MPGVYVAPHIIAQLDDLLGGLYGLVNSGVELISEDVPDGTEKHIICTGLITHFFLLYHTLNAVGLLRDISYMRCESVRRWREYFPPRPNEPEASQGA